MSALPHFPTAAKGVSLLKERAAQRKTAANYVPMPPSMAGLPSVNLVDEPFWNDLPDILQAQVMVALDFGKPKRGEPPRPAEKLLWAGTPFLRTRTILTLFLVWIFLLVVPVFFLVEFVDEVGGWCALAWAFVSVFIFVPRISRSSRVVHALTTQRAFTSSRTMFCSIETEQVRYENVVDAKLRLNGDQTATIELFYHNGPFEPMGRVKFDRIRDLRNACRVLDEMLPTDIKQGLMGSQTKRGPDRTETESETKPMRQESETVSL
ncbi:hypothetical protein AB1Y20_010069 [Prymnesium parvum]|uniref:DUF304 domain-containing protein n=1 Tax=Prymnesium parvum TaxID=97485 RepID=A0AB34K791_PRYPA